ncbi:Polyamine transporter 4 [Erysiphe neolycopersici]|uniref:Polyamine transporter 4 n=1 Tax=Erysiphe neolycopersici TaxID=212602 RepID=A0A420I450_9PEZI|nr:Polyamine transporter 4 [Erysiphe neolycopersici]
MYNGKENSGAEGRTSGFVPIIDMNSSFLHESDSDEEEVNENVNAFNTSNFTENGRTKSTRDTDVTPPHRQNSIMSFGSRARRIKRGHSPAKEPPQNETQTEQQTHEEDKSEIPDPEELLCRTASKTSTIKDGGMDENDDTSSCMMHGLSCVPSALSSIHYDWDAPTNEENPRNWCLSKKVFHTAIPALYGFVLTVGTSAYVPAVPLIMMKFKVSREIALLPLAFYTFGFTVGPVIYAPLSELYGRRIVYWVSMPLLLSFTAICGLSNNITLLIVMRFIASLTGSGALAVGAGTILDLWKREYQGFAALAFIMAPFLGPCLGPLIGAVIIKNRNYNWRWSMWIVLLIAIPVAIASLFLKETSKSRILYKKARLTVEKEVHKKGDMRLFLRKLRQALFRPCHMMLFEPLVALLSIYTAFAFAMLFSFFASYNFVFLIVYHFDMIKVGTTFLGILVGFVFALLSFAFFDTTLYRKEFVKHHGEPAPEHRLYNALLGSIMLPIGLFWFAWTPTPSVHWIVPILAGIPFGWGTLSIFISVTAYLVEVYQINSSSAVAANGILRYSFGGAFPLFTLQLYTSLGIHWAGSVFAILSLVLLPVPWIFYWKGRSLRAKSCYDTNTA